MPLDELIARTPEAHRLPRWTNCGATRSTRMRSWRSSSRSLPSRGTLTEPRTLVVDTDVAFGLAHAAICRWAPAGASFLAARNQPSAREPCRLGLLASRHVEAPGPARGTRGTHDIGQASQSGAAFGQLRARPVAFPGRHMGGTRGRWRGRCGGLRGERRCQWALRALGRGLGCGSACGRRARRRFRGDEFRFAARLGRGSDRARKAVISAEMAMAGLGALLTAGGVDSFGGFPRGFLCPGRLRRWRPFAGGRAGPAAPPRQILLFPA